MTNEFYTLDQLAEILKRPLPQAILSTPVSVCNNGGGNENTFQNVHIYDNQFSVKCKKCSLSAVEQKDVLDKFINLLQNPFSKLMVGIIVQEKQAVDGGDLTTVDILLDIISRPMTTDILFLLEEQLADAFHLGRCLQGIVNRLQQILLLFPT